MTLQLSSLEMERRKRVEHLVPVLAAVRRAPPLLYLALNLMFVLRFVLVLLRFVLLPGCIFPRLANRLLRQPRAQRACSPQTHPQISISPT